MLKISENNGTEEIGFVTPTPEDWGWGGGGGGGGVCIIQ